jgi:Flp pilus assembly protein TadG
MVAFATEVGRMFLLRSEVQNAVDAGALAAALELRRNATAVDVAATAAQDYVQRNRAGSAVEIPDNLIDVEVGTWDSQTRLFTATNVSPNSVRVFARQNEPFFFARIFGMTTFDAPASAVASGGGAPLDIMMVLDLSGSMSSNGRIQALQNAAPTFVQVIEDFGGDDQIGVMGYGGKLEDFDADDDGNGIPYASAPAELYPANDTNVGVLEAALTNDFATLRTYILTSSNLIASKYGGGTPTGAGLRDGAHYLVNAPTARENVERVIVLMSDGHANKPSSNGDGYALDMASYAAGLDIKVYTISLGTSADEQLMEDIAAATGAVHFDATGSGEAELTAQLIDAFARIAAQIKRSQLVK